MLLALLTLFAVSNAGRRGGGGNHNHGGNDCEMTADRTAELISSFDTGTTTLYCRLKAPRRFPHWTEACPDPTEEPITTSTTAQPSAAVTEAPPAVEVLAAESSESEEEGPGQRRLLRRGGRRGGSFRRAKTQFTVSEGSITGFKNKAGCRDDTSFTCFDDLTQTDCAYTYMEASTVGSTVTLTLMSKADETTGQPETITLVCPFEGKVKGDDCTAPEEEMIQCTDVTYDYGGETERFGLQCSTEEHPWVDREGNDLYPACPQVLQ